MNKKYKWLGENYNNSLDIPDGWYKAFGEDMIEELNKILIKYNLVNSYEILQIKEKFGQLRWYGAGVSEEAWDEYGKWLSKYEELSSNTCIKCGKDATHMSKGWILPLCDNCGTREAKVEVGNTVECVETGEIGLVINLDSEVSIITPYATKSSGFLEYPIVVINVVKGIFIDEFKDLETLNNYYRVVNNFK